MVVRFVGVIRVPALVRPRVPCVSRVCPGSPGIFLPVPRKRASGASYWQTTKCDVEQQQHVMCSVGAEPDRTAGGGVSAERDREITD